MERGSAPVWTRRTTVRVARSIFATSSFQSSVTYRKRPAASMTRWRGFQPTFRSQRTCHVTRSIWARSSVPMTATHAVRPSGVMAMPRGYGPNLMRRTSRPAARSTTDTS